VNEMAAVIKTGGKQYRVEKDQVLKVEKLNTEPGEQVVFEDVLMMSEGGDIKIGTPNVENATVTAEVLAQGRSRKIIVFKKKRRQNYRRTAGHRQHETTIKIIGIDSVKKVVAKKVVATTKADSAEIEKIIDKEPSAKKTVVKKTTAKKVDTK
jgi:large subunit ribosomal protein L21